MPTALSRTLLRGTKWFRVVCVNRYFQFIHVVFVNIFYLFIKPIVRTNLKRYLPILFKCLRVLMPQAENYRTHSSIIEGKFNVIHYLFFR